LNKANYWVDVAIGFAGLGSAVSGLVLLMPGDPTVGILGLGYQVWSNLHTWSSLMAILGVVAHMALHWKWLVAMTKQMIRPARVQQASERIAEAPSGNPAATGLSRRAFLVFGGAATVVAGAALAGYKAMFANAAEASQSDSQTTATVQEAGVACPRNLVNDPYPGRCRLYIDADGDGICDYSVPGSGNSVASTGERSDLSRGSRRHGGF
jgi:hypothetical protein